MTFVVGVLTFVLVANCLLLILLVLVQLPKKDAGAGMAFGGGTADALFGAGSGNALTKITKYAAIIFLALSLVVGFLQSKLTPSHNAADFAKQVEQNQQQRAAIPNPPPPKAEAPVPAANNLLSTPMAATNAARPTMTATNAAK